MADVLQGIGMAGGLTMHANTRQDISLILHGTLELPGEPSAKLHCAEKQTPK